MSKENFWKVSYMSFDQRMQRPIPSDWFQGDETPLFACLPWILSFPEIWTAGPLKVVPDSVISCHELKRGVLFQDKELNIYG